MVLLHQFPIEGWVLPNASPFCIKMETWLRLAGIEYESRPWSPMKAPMGKAPFIEHEGVIVGDSSCSIDHLSRVLGVSLDKGMTPEEIGIATLVQRTLEEHTYWGLIYSRWLEPDRWAHYKNIISAGMPSFVKPLMLPILHRGTTKAAHAQGLSRHDRAEVIRRITADLDAVASILGDKDFLLGDQPRSIDATVYAFVASFAVPPEDHPMRDAVRRHDNLMAYLDRMKTRCWG